MSLREEIRSLDPKRKDLVQFGLLVGAVFLLIGWLLERKEAAPAIWVLGLGGTLVLLGAVLPRMLAPVYRVWMTLALGMGFVMTRVILTIFYFLLVTPFGLAMRLFGKDLLDQKLDRNAKTYWKPKEYLIADRTRFEKYF
jgi:hypothetical protein